MAPRCTGTCGALATSLPSGANRAQEKSRRSRTLTDCADWRNASPICSAAAMNRLPMISITTGSRRVPMRRRARRAARVSNNSPPGRTTASQPVSMMVVAVASMTMAGPGIWAPTARFSRRYNAASRQAPSNQAVTPVSGSAGPPPGGGLGLEDCPAAVRASTRTAATTCARPGSTNPKRR